MRGQSVFFEVESKFEKRRKTEKGQKILELSAEQKRKGMEEQAWDCSLLLGQGIFAFQVTEEDRHHKPKAYFLCAWAWNTSDTGNHESTFRQNPGSFKVRPRRWASSAALLLPVCCLY
jgi:hypothetical protein